MRQRNWQARREELDKKRINLTALKEGIPVLTVDRTSEAYNVRLRNEIRKRVERIDLAFNAEILSTPDPTVPSRTSPRERET
jgi:hypothetical protein